MSIDGEKLLADLKAQLKEALEALEVYRGKAETFDAYELSGIAAALTTTISAINSGDYTTKDGQS